MSVKKVWNKKIFFLLLAAALLFSAMPVIPVSFSLTAYADEGDSIPEWIPGTLYVQGDRVQWNGLIFECINDLITGDEPLTDENYWVRVITPTPSDTPTPTPTPTPTSTPTPTPTPIPVSKSVWVGTQMGSLTQGVAGSVTFPISTSGIANGTYPVSVSNLPNNVSIVNSSGVVTNSVTISNNYGQLILRTASSTVLSTNHSLWLTLDGVTSNNFTFGINASGNYYVTITGSNANTTGQGYYDAGQTVSIYAGSRSDYYFDGWSSSSSGVSFANRNSASTTFIMPSHNVTITANWIYYDDYNWNNNTGGGGGRQTASTGVGTSGGTNFIPTPTPTPFQDSFPAPAPANTLPPSPDEFKLPGAVVTNSLVLNEFSPEINGVKPYVMVQVDASTKIGAVSPRVFTNFIGGSVDFIDGVAVLWGTHTNGTPTEVRMVANDTTAAINGQSHDIATYSESAGPGLVSVYVSETNNFYVPLRFMAKAFGYEIEWNAATSTATIKSRTGGNAGGFTPF